MTRKKRGKNHEKFFCPVVITCGNTWFLTGINEDGNYSFVNEYQQRWNLPFKQSKHIRDIIVRKPNMIKKIKKIGGQLNGFKKQWMGFQLTA